jgi:hypothetical protein
MLIKKWALLLGSASLLAYEETIPLSDNNGKIPVCWTTGTLLAPPSDIIPMGHLNYEPYLYWTSFHGVYDDKWNFQRDHLFTTVSVKPLIRLGVFPRGEFDITPTLTYKHTQGAAMWVWEDFPISINGLVRDDDPEHWYRPSVLLLFSANLPIGKYQRLQESKLGTDIGGKGSWSPGVGLILYHAAHLYASHFLTTTFFATYQFQTNVYVHGLNAFGGDRHTRGRVYPGDFTQLTLSFEFCLSQNWSLALDAEYNHMNKSRFKGHTHTPSTLPSYEQFILAPAVEYTWSENFGIIAGSWFTVAGRNTNEFVGGVIAIYINK